MRVEQGAAGGRRGRRASTIAVAVWLVVALTTAVLGPTLVATPVAALGSGPYV